MGESFQRVAAWSLSLSQYQPWSSSPSEANSPATAAGEGVADLVGSGGATVLVATGSAVTDEEAVPEGVAVPAGTQEVTNRQKSSR